MAGMQRARLTIPSHGGCRTSPPIHGDPTWPTVLLFPSSIDYNDAAVLHSWGCLPVSETTCLTLSGVQGQMSPCLLQFPQLARSSKGRLHGACVHHPVPQTNLHSRSSCCAKPVSQHSHLSLLPPSRPTPVCHGGGLFPLRPDMVLANTLHSPATAVAETVRARQT